MLCTINITVFHRKVKGEKWQFQKSVKSAEFEKISFSVHKERAALGNPLRPYLFLLYREKN